MTDHPGIIDLHMHTTVSDGTDTPEAIVEKIAEAKIGVFSVTDHDAVKAARIIPDILSPDGPAFIPGAEFSCRDGEGKYHILAYGYDPEGEAINALVEHGHSLRMNKVRKRIALLFEQFGFSFPEDELEVLFSLDNPGKPHIGNLMVKYGYAETKESAIKDYIDRLRVKSEYISPEEAIGAILASGGVPVLAHPFFGSGDELIIGEEMVGRLRRLTGFGLRGIEAFYSGFTAKLRKNALALAESFDLLVTAGSDYHGKNKLVRLGDTGLDPNQAVPERMRRFFDAVGL